MIGLPHRVFVLGYVAAILLVTVLSLIPQPQLDAPEGTDKALHLLAYGVIAGCAGLGFANWKRRIFAGTTAIGIGIFLGLHKAPGPAATAAWPTPCRTRRVSSSGWSRPISC